VSQQAHMARRILLATGNAHKVREIQRILHPLLPNSIEILSLANTGLGSLPDEVEHFQTFSANARAKAEWCRDRSGIECIADDSGLCVDALAGAPGVRSARWAGPTDADRNRALLLELELARADAESTRTAQFVCSAAFASADTSIPTIVALGSSRGRILTLPVGAAGFGYDPVFFSPELEMTFAEAKDAEKDRVSHRGRALHMLISHIVEFVQ